MVSSYPVFQFKSPRFEPLLVDIHPKLIRTCPAKEVLDGERNGIEGRIKAAVIARVVDHSVHSRNDPFLPPDIYGRPGIALRILRLDLYPTPHPESVIHRPRTLL
jgi:hypothetical protein